jgi:hypothetical protein
VQAHANHILIGGHDGGTGASPIASIQHAGTPQIGLSETHILMLNGLRDGLYCRRWSNENRKRCGNRSMLGAEEFGFATAPLITQGCIMMRKCHLNTCPAGVATQDPELRKRFAGKPEYVINFMFYIAEEVREFMASMGFRKFNDMIGRTEKIIPQRLHNHWKARGLDLSKLLFKSEPIYPTNPFRTREQDHALEYQIDHELIKLARPALEKGKNVNIKMAVKNTNRTVGAMLSGEVAKKYGDQGLPDRTILIEMNGTAGQSFGTFLAKGIELKLTGESNDYTGKGLSGGKLIIKVPEGIT